MPMCDFTLEYQYTEGDHQEVYEAIRRTVLARRWKRFFLVLALLLLLFAALWFLKPALWIFSFLFGAFAGVLATGLSYLRVSRQRYQDFWNRTQALRDPVVTRIREAGVSRKGPSVQSEWKWPAFTCFVETPNILLLKQGAYSVPIPKRACKTPDEYSQLLTFIRTKVSAGPLA